MKDLLKKLGATGALLVCIPVIWRIFQGDAFNAMSFFLWSSLAGISGIVLFRANEGGHLLMAAYFLSDLSVGVFAMLKSKKAIIGRFEVLTLVLIAVCVIVWLRCEAKKQRTGVKNYKASVIANATAIMVAGIPQFIDVWVNPTSVSRAICWSYITISAMSYFGEKPTLNARLIPGLSVLYWIPIVIRIYTKQ